MSTVEKQYGLIEPKTGKKLTISDVFNNDSDSEGEEGERLKKSGTKEEKGLKRQTKLEMQRALQQDPTVYLYDEIYDEMSQKKQETEQAKVCPEKKPKYIQNLMRTADWRKKENERRLERQIQKEREAEGDMYKDKEEFITSSYKQKLEEFKKAEEEEKKMEYIESVMDVSKQKDLGGFYRHLFKETVSNEDTAKLNEKLGDPGDGALPETLCSGADEKLSEVVKHERNYRKRNSSIDEEEKEIKQESTSSSSDSDSSSDSSSSSSSSEDEKTEVKPPEAKVNEAKSGPEDGEIVEDKTKKEQEKSKLGVKNHKPGSPKNKSDSKDDRSKNGSGTSKPEVKDRRDKSYRSVAYDRDRGGKNLSRRDDRNYRDRDRRDDRKIYERSERRSNDSRRRRSRSPESRRGRHRSRERSRSRRDNERRRDSRDMRNNHNVDKKKEAKEIKKTEVKEAELKKENESGEQPRVSIWEKRTVGAIYEAAVERYQQRKAVRGL